MIRVTIKQAAKARGIKKPYHLALKTGIGRSRATDLWENRREPSFNTLDVLCRELECELGELIQYVGTRRPKSPESNGKRR